MPKHEDMMILSDERRRGYFRSVYALRLAKLHATGVCRWDLEKLPDMVETVMRGLEKRQAPQGQAFDETKKFFGLRTNKATFHFLGLDGE